jgi:hypothetical protein
MKNSANMTTKPTAKQLSKEALEAINTNPKLFGTICDLLDIKPTTLIAHLQRNSTRLNQYVVVMAVAETMGLTPDDILEEKEAVAKAV